MAVVDWVFLPCLLTPKFEPALLGLFYAAETLYTIGVGNTCEPVQYFDGLSVVFDPFEVAYVKRCFLAYEAMLVSMLLVLTEF